MKQHSLRIHGTSIPSPDTKHACQSEGNSIACPDLKAAEHIIPINLKMEPDQDPYFLSLELSSRESTIRPDDHNMKLEVLDLKSEIKSDLSTDEHFSFKTAEMIVDPFKDCVKPETAQANCYGIPEHSCESPDAAPEDELQRSVTQVKKDRSNTEVLVLTEPNGSYQNGRVCHLLRYRTHINKRLVKQQSENESCEGAKCEIYKAKTKLEDIHVACSLCGNAFANSSCLKVHMQIHTREEPHKEPTCGKALPFKSKLKIQRGQKQSAQRFPCSQCDKTFAFSSGLRVHMRAHTGERPYHCHICGKDFSRSDFLAMHMKYHERTQTGERPFKCDQCGKKLTSRGFLQLHKERSHGFSTKQDGPRERQYSCGSCGKAFMTKQSLRSHETSHTDSKPYVCTQCGHSFRRKDSLTKHMRIHTKERPYSCGYCGKTFPYTHCLKSHVEIHKRTKK